MDCFALPHHDDMKNVCDFTERERERGDENKKFKSIAHSREEERERERKDHVENVNCRRVPVRCLSGLVPHFILKILV